MIQAGGEHHNVKTVVTRHVSYCYGNTSCGIVVCSILGDGECLLRQLHAGVRIMVSEDTEMGHEVSCAGAGERTYQG